MKSTSPFSHPAYKWLAVVIILLVIAGARIIRLSLDDKELHVDEVWSVWQLMGDTHTYALDTNWPPLYYFALDIWRSVAGFHPIALRLFSALLFTLGSAFTYRALKRLRDEPTALLGMLAYGAVALGLFFTTEVRGNSLIYSLLPLAFWLLLRYFDRPTWRRAVPLGISLAVMFYTAYSSFGVFLMFGLFTLVQYPRKIWRWLLPGLVALPLALPEISRVAARAVGRVAATDQIKLDTLNIALLRLLEADAGTNFLAWVILFAVATGLIMVRARQHKLPWGLLVWTLSPILLYVLNPVLGFFSPTYGWFIVPGVVFWIAWGLALLPNIGRIVAGAVLAGIAFTSIPYDNFQAAGAPIGRSLAWLADHAQWGDVVTIDPLWWDEFCGRRDCINAEVWDYMIRLYFPQGLEVVSDPDGYRRVWYLKWDGPGWHDADFEAKVRENRVASEFVGPFKALFRLYEAPPDSEGVLFANGMRFHGMDVVGESPRPLVRREGDSLRVRLWWSVDEPVEADYSIALHLYANGGEIAAQSDSGPQLIDPNLPPQTSAWQPDTYYIEERTLTLPDILSSRPYPIFLTVYQWWDGKRVDAPGSDERALITIGTLRVKGW